MAESQPRSKRALLLKLGAVAGVLLVAGLLLARGVDLKGLVQQGLGLIREAGPVVFFVAMALLPAVGAPVSFFSLTAGSVFSAQLGMPLVVALSMLALLVNMALSYFLATRALRPLLESVVTRLGYKLPQVASDDATDLIVLLRVTPGIPFPVQNYLLGLARVPFRKYMIVSGVIACSLTTAFILFGDALLHGKGRVALVSLLLILALSMATHLVRKHYAKKTPR
ncbi:MAG TPA: VTT domain-containing protein [Lacunisphaera sp.]|nr:VTT domain-containing protein [Lacunisphaera sp.]